MVLTPAVVAACAPQEQIAFTPPAAPKTITTVRVDGPGMSSVQEYEINKACFAGWSGMGQVARSNAARQKQSTFLEAAETALQRGVAAGAATGKSADQVRVDFEGRAAVAKQDEKAAAADFLLCSFVYPTPGQPE
jgi:hypothetical protein